MLTTFTNSIAPIFGDYICVGGGLLTHNAHENYKLGFPSPGTWRLRRNGDWKGYSRAFGNQACSDVVAEAEPSDAAQNTNIPERDGFPAAGTISIGPYSVLIFSQDKNLW